MPSTPPTATSAAVFPAAWAQENTPVQQQPACVMSFNAHDASGALGIGADVLTLASMGAHPCPVACGIYSSDTQHIFGHQALEAELLAEQARGVLEDMAVHAFKIGFVGSTANIHCITEICSDYPHLPVISYMPDLSWWHQGHALEDYLDAFEALLLPQTAVLVGNHSTLARWLLPDWSHQRPPSPRDIAKAALVHDTPYILATGIEAVGQQWDNVLACADSILGSSRFTHLPQRFTGTGETLSAALAALLVTGNDLGLAAAEALEYMDQSLVNSFRPGMGASLPDRMFWAQAQGQGEEESTPLTKKD
ncbi:MAG: bifunctional hydroxymethylpyrimidine kinase/phosphomethylpyrimidine kinase [Comamonas sp.]|nr:bifunctional hydroxymethylpyrimidine kinase/phosphomethylpyrimidine kinase [Comamonas sp.]